MPSFNVVVRANRLFVDGPFLGCKNCVLDPLPFNVIYQITKGLCVGLNTEADEHWSDLVKWQEGSGHQLSNVAVNTVIRGLCHLESHLLYLLQRNNKYVSNAGVVYSLEFRIA